MCPSQKDQKIKEVRAIVKHIKNHPSYTIALKEFLENLIFFIVDFEYEQYDHVADWLRMYDIQALCQKYPVRFQPIINPDYLQEKPECFAKEFETIRDFFEYTRNYVKSA